MGSGGLGRLTIGGGRIPLSLLGADEHGESRVGNMETLAWKTGHWQSGRWTHRCSFRYQPWGPQVPPSSWPPETPRGGTHTHRDHRLKEAIEKQVPIGLAVWEVGHEPDEEVGDDGQGRGEDDPEEEEGVSEARGWRLEAGAQEPGLAQTAVPHRVPTGKEGKLFLPSPFSCHPPILGLWEDADGQAWNGRW